MIQCAATQCSPSFQQIAHVACCYPGGHELLAPCAQVHVNAEITHEDDITSLSPQMLPDAL